jgi:hypothetical protein
MNKYGNSYLNDSDISRVSGGMSTGAKIGLIAGLAAIAVGGAYGIKTVYNKKKSDTPAPDLGKAANLFSKAWWTGKDWE